MHNQHHGTDCPFTIGLWRHKKTQRSCCNYIIVLFITLNDSSKKLWAACCCVNSRPRSRAKEVLPAWWVQRKQASPLCGLLVATWGERTHKTDRKTDRWQVYSHSRCFFFGVVCSCVVALHTALHTSDPVSVYCAAAMRSVSVWPDIFSPVSQASNGPTPPRQKGASVIPAVLKK